VVNNKQPKWSIRSSVAFVIAVLFIAGGFVFTGFKPAAHYGTFSGSMVLILGLYLGKRIWKHQINVKNNFTDE